MFRTPLHPAIWAVLAALCLPACAATEPSPAATDGSLTVLPFGTRWTFADSSRAGLRVPEASHIVLQIEPGQLSGDSGCNRYSAGVALSADGRITLEPIAATKRGCPGPAGTIEAAYFDALRAVQSISRDGDRLTLHLADGDRLQFNAAPPETE